MHDRLLESLPRSLVDRAFGVQVRVSKGRGRGCRKINGTGPGAAEGKSNPVVPSGTRRSCGCPAAPPQQAAIGARHEERKVTEGPCVVSTEADTEELTEEGLATRFGVLFPSSRRKGPGTRSATRRTTSPPIQTRLVVCPARGPGSPELFS